MSATLTAGHVWQHLGAIKAGLAQAFRVGFPARNEARTLLASGATQVLVSPAVHEPSGTACVKVTSLVPENPSEGRPLIHGLVVLVSLHTGEVLATIDGGALTAARTGALAAIATQAVAHRPDGVLALVGAGAQARACLAALFEGHPSSGVPSRVRVWSRTPQRRAAFVAWAHARHGIEVQPCTSVDEAVRSADVVCTTTATDAAVPLVRAEVVGPRTHLNIIGGTHEDALEVDPQLVQRSFVVLEDVALALAEAGELRAVSPPPRCHTLTDVLRDRPEHDGPTVYRSVGLSIEDAVAASALYEASKCITVPSRTRNDR